MKQIQTTTVKMTAEVEVLPLNSALVARIVKNGMELNNAIGEIRTCLDAEEEIHLRAGDGYTHDLLQYMQDANELLQDIYYAFIGATDTDGKAKDTKYSLCE